MTSGAVEVVACTTKEGMIFWGKHVEKRKGIRKIAIKS
jgi:hypothetical protein